MTTSVFISNEFIQVALGHYSGGKAVIDRLYMEPVPAGSIIGGVITNDFALKGQIKALWTKKKLPDKKINLIIDSSSLATKKLSMPSVPPVQLSRLVEESYIESDSVAEEARTFDFSVINPKNADGGIDVLACAAEDDFLNTYVELFESQGIKLDKIDVALNCELKLARTIKALAKKTYIMAVLDGRTLNLTLFVNGVFSFHNRSRLVADRGSDEVCEEILRKLSSIVQFNKSEKTGFDITDTYFGGMREEEMVMCGTMSASIGMNVEVMPNFDELVLACNKKINTRVEGIIIADCVYTFGNLIQ